MIFQHFSENSTWGWVCLANLSSKICQELSLMQNPQPFLPIFCFFRQALAGFPSGETLPRRVGGNGVRPCHGPLCRAHARGWPPAISHQSSWSRFSWHLLCPVDEAAADFSTNAVKVPVRKDQRFVTKVAEIPSKLLRFGKNLWIFLKRNFGVLEDLMKLKSMFRVFVTLRIQSLAHRKKHGFFCGVPMLMCMIHLLRLCVGGVCRHIWGCDELRSLYFCTISEGFVFLTHLDKPERVIPFTCCQPPFGLIVGKWAKGPKVCIYRVHQTLTPLKNTQPFHMRLTFANVTSFCLFWGSDCWEVGRWECHRAIDSICGWLKTRCTRSAWVAWKPLTAGRDRALDLLGFLRSNKTESKNESLFFCFSGMVFWGQKFLSFR